MCFPIFLFFVNIVNRRTYAMVVEISRVPVPSINSLKIETFGTARDFELSSLLGWGPPRAFLLSFKYLYSGVLLEKR